MKLPKVLLAISFCCLLMRLSASAQHLIKYSERPNGHSSPYRASIKEVLKSPEVYHTTHLQVTGYLELGFEGNVIYQDKKEIKKKRPNALWLDITRSEMAKWNKYKGSDVIIDAIFDANDHGHMNAWGGTLKNLTSIKLYKGNR